MNVKDIIGLIIFIIIVFLVFNLLFNALLSIMITKRFKLPVQKRFKGKMTPLYELDSWSDGGNRSYWVTKWELQYVGFEMVASWQIMMIPFSVLFSRMKYVVIGTYQLGVLSEQEVSKLDISFEWYKLNQIKREQELAKEIKKYEYQKLMDKVNKDFKENYTE
jgi:hypothetical protein